MAEVDALMARAQAGEQIFIYEVLYYKDGTSLYMNELGKYCKHDTHMMRLAKSDLCSTEGSPSSPLVIIFSWYNFADHCDGKSFLFTNALLARAYWMRCNKGAAREQD